MHRLYAQLEQSSMEYIEESGMFEHASADDWYLLQRAGVWSRQYNMQASSQPQPLAGHSSKSKAKGCFFLDVGVLGATLVVPIGDGLWREDVMERLQHAKLPDLLCQQLAAGDWRHNGRHIPDEHPTSSIVDSTLRLAFPGLAGGMPPKKDYQQMTLTELRKLTSTTPIGC